MTSIILESVQTDDSFLLSAFLEGLGSPTLLCILGNRVFFNLEEAAEHGVNVGTNWSSHSHSSIHFEEPHHGVSDFESVNVPSQKSRFSS